MTEAEGQSGPESAGFQRECGVEAAKVDAVDFVTCEEIRESLSPPQRVERLDECWCGGRNVSPERPVGV